METIGKDEFTYAPSKNTADANILEYINIPASVTSIGENFLKGALKNDGSSIIVMQGDTPPEIGSGAFVSGRNTEYEFTLIYPAEAKTAYVDAGLVSEDDDKGISFTFPSAPTKPGYIFLGWRGADGTMYGAGTAEFSPNATLTRAMVWAILARLDGETITGDT